MKHRSDRVPVGVSLSGSAAGCPGENLLYQDWNNALANISPVSKFQGATIEMIGEVESCSWKL